MTAFSTFLADQMANFTYRAESFTVPAALFMSLYQSEPGEDDTGVELVGAGYVRQGVSFGAPSARRILSDVPVTFGPASADWVRATHVGLHNALSGGDLLCYDKIGDNQDVLSGESRTFPTGQLSVEMLGNISDYWANALLAHVFNNVPATAPSSLYMAPYVDDPGFDDSGTELTGNGMARQLSTWNPAVNGACALAADVNFPPATPAAQGASSHFALKDAVTAGNLITFGPWSAGITIPVGGYLEMPEALLVQRFS